MVTILVVGLIAWVFKGAAEDVIRAWRGEPSTAPRGGFRGYANDRWKALADHHHAVAASGMLTHSDARQARRHLARTKALKLAGFATEEEVARAKAEHQHRLGFIAKGIDPDTMPPLFPVRGKVWEPVEPGPPADNVLVDEPSTDPEPAAEPEREEPGVSIDGHFYDNVQVWLNPEYFPPEPADPTPQDEPWDPFKNPTSNTKENHMANNGEITGPASVLQFHNDLAEVMSAAASIVDTLTGLGAELEQRAGEFGANITATETASAGMTGLGMDASAAAATVLMETQKSIQESMNAIAAAVKQHAGTILDQAEASQSQLAAIKSAHDAQLAVQDARAGAGHGNLATDQFLDGND